MISPHYLWLFQVEKLLKVRGKKGKREFLVKWKGYPKSESTWEAEQNLNCKALIKAFEKKQEKEDDEYEVLSLYYSHACISIV